MKFHVEIEREIDGCWIAEVPKISGMFACRAYVHEAIDKSQAVALRWLAECTRSGNN